MYPWLAIAFMAGHTDRLSVGLGGRKKCCIKRSQFFSFWKSILEARKEVVGVVGLYTESGLCGSMMRAVHPLAEVWRPRM